MPTTARRSNSKVRDFRLLDEQIRRALQRAAHQCPVKRLVFLRPGRPDGRTSAGIQQSELNSRLVRNEAHDAAQCVDLANQVALRDASNGGIARHLRDQIRVHRVERGCAPHARGRMRRFASGMTCADNDYIVGLVEHRYLPIQNVEKIRPRISSVVISPVNSFSADRLS